MFLWVYIFFWLGSLQLFCAGLDSSFSFSPTSFEDHSMTYFILWAFCRNPGDGWTVWLAFDQRYNGVFKVTGNLGSFVKRMFITRNFPGDETLPPEHKIQLHKLPKEQTFCENIRNFQSVILSFAGPLFSRVKCVRLFFCGFMLLLPQEEEYLCLNRRTVSVACSLTSGTLSRWIFKCEVSSVLECSAISLGKFSVLLISGNKWPIPWTSNLGSTPLWNEPWVSLSWWQFSAWVAPKQVFTPPDSVAIMTHVHSGCLIRRGTTEQSPVGWNNVAWMISFPVWSFSCNLFFLFNFFFFCEREKRLLVVHTNDPQLKFSKKWERFFGIFYLF